MSETGSRKIHFDISTIETIDKSVYNFVNGLALSTMTNKGFQPVPVIWATAERSYQSKIKKEGRDKQGLLVLPIISIKRTSFTKSAASPGVFQGNVPENSDDQGGSLGINRVLYQEKTMKFANADAMRLYGQKNYPYANPKIVYKTVSVPMPVNVEIMYEIILRTEYQQQMNDLMTPFATKSGTVNYVRLKEKGHKYEGFIQDAYTSTDNLSDFSSDERKFETKVGLKVIGYLIGEGKNREKPHYAIRENAVEVKIPRERISLAEIPEHEFGAYYGLAGLPPIAMEVLGAMRGSLSNTPAASFFAGTGGGSAESADAVTTKTFADILSQNLVVREVLKEVEVIPADLVNFTALHSIKDNTELVFVNGLLQTQGALYDYSISGGKTIVFSENVENNDFIVITYVKG